jgi:hypothetical protein
MVDRKMPKASWNVEVSQADKWTRWNAEVKAKFLCTRNSNHDLRKKQTISKN